MGFPAYKCDTEFPDCIPEVLSATGARIEPESRASKALFAYRVTRGLGAVSIVGVEEHGEIVFAVPWGRNLNPLTWWWSNRLSREVQEKLVRAGAKPVWTREDQE